MEVHKIHFPWHVVMFCGVHHRPYEYWGLTLELILKINCLLFFLQEDEGEDD